MHVARCSTHLVLVGLVSTFAAGLRRPGLLDEWTGAVAGAAEREVLYNGIPLPETWPPRIEHLPHEPVAPPYLLSPPRVIPIDIGRQLLMDDFLIERTDLKRTYHAATYWPTNPVLKPDRPWETKTQPNPCAMVFSDGVWYDPQDRLFKMWYMAGYVAGTAYATSKDGIHWEKPQLDVFPGTNLVQQGWRDSSTVWLDHAAADPQARFKMALYTGDRLSLYTSPDGIHWSPPVRSGPTGDRTTFFYNPFRKRWVYSLRTGAAGFGRARNYWEAEYFVKDANWSPGQPALWVGTDSADPQREDLKTPCQLYNLDCAAYESLLLGLFSIWRGQPKDRAKPNEVCLGFSRDGFHWYRPDRRPFIPVSDKQGDWNWGNVQSAGGACLVVGDKLYFYVSGRAGVPGSTSSGVCSTGLATLRRDGFASLDAGEVEGSLTTRPVRFQGRYLFVNADAGKGTLRAEILDADGRVIPPFTRDNCIPLSEDTTLGRIRWKQSDEIGKLAGRPVRFRFHLTKGNLYAFWVSPDPSGASYGYVAAGGPGLTGPTDRVGSQALESVRRQTAALQRRPAGDSRSVLAGDKPVASPQGPATNRGLRDVIGVTHVAGKYHLTDKVLPQTRVDLVSYSAWDTEGDPALLHKALDYIARHVPDRGPFGGRNVYLGEFGLPENDFPLPRVQQTVRGAMQTALDWGCPYVVYWQLYCNEPRRRPVKTNADMRGFWLLRPDGSKAWLWQELHDMLKR